MFANVPFFLLSFPFLVVITKDKSSKHRPITVHLYTPTSPGKKLYDLYKLNIGVKRWMPSNGQIGYIVFPITLIVYPNEKRFTQ